MNNGPYPFARQMQAVDALLQATPTWDGLGEALFSGGKPAYQPGDGAKKFAAAAMRTTEGRAFMEFIADITVRSDPETSGLTIEAAALSHAKREARHAVGRAIFHAAAEGEAMFNQPRSQPT